MTSPFQALQSAVDVVNTSSHETNRIAATLFHEKEGWSISCVNYWPKLIDKKIGRLVKIGNSSGTIHAETACIFRTGFVEGRKTQGASIAVTDPPCPNCVKNMAEAGIDNIYIDHKGFHKDYAMRRSEYFEAFSLRLAEKAGISIYEVNRKAKTITPITIADKSYIPANEKPIKFVEEDKNYISLRTLKDKEKTAYAFCQNTKGKQIQIISISHPALGFDSAADQYEITHPETKYSYIQEACNRLLMNAARHGLKIEKSEIYVSEVPTSRELVNLVGAGIQKVHISNPEKARDNDAIIAKKQLENAKIIIFPE